MDQESLVPTLEARASSATARVVVMKFGGTSVRDAAHIRRVVSIIGRDPESSRLVVVSAQAGVTDALTEAIERAQRGGDSNPERLLRRWRGLAADLEVRASERPALEAVIEAVNGRAAELLHGVKLLGECSPRVRDAVVSLGEIVSHALVAAALREIGVIAVAIDPRELVPTDDQHGRAGVDTDALAERAARLVAPHLRAGRVVVTGGFVGAAPSGATTTLGRGGSDLSATVLAAAIGADRVEIWTDVAGLMTADPRVVRGARRLPVVSFDEASELAHFGAKVLHPLTLRPAITRGIPVSVRKTCEPDAEGTAIHAAGVAKTQPSAVLAVVQKRDIAIVSLRSSRMLGSHGFLARVFEVFARHEVAVDVVTTSEVSLSLTVDDVRAIELLEPDLRELGGVTIEHDRALCCLVGHGFLGNPRLLSDALAALDGLSLRMVGLGATDVNLSFVVRSEDADDAVRRLHGRFLEDSR